MQTMDEVAQMVKNLIAEEMNIEREKITPDTRLVQDLGLDSFDVVSLVTLLEAELGQDLDEEKLTQLVTFQDVVQLVMQQLKAQSLDSSV